LRNLVDSNSVFYKSDLNDNVDSLNASVLLVEDNWAQQKSIKDILKKIPVTTAVVGNGKQAIAAVNERMRKN
jgi:PleD family two-component response regulator